MIEPPMSVQSELNVELNNISLFCPHWLQATTNIVWPDLQRIDSNELIL